MSNLNIKNALALVLVTVVGLVVYTVAPAGVIALWRMQPAGALREPSDVNDLQAENAQLRMRVSNLEINTSASENIATSSLPENRAQLRIIARPPVTGSDIVVAETGSSDDITRGALVWTPNEIAFGEVIDIRNNAVFIQLFSRAGVETAASLDSRVPVSLIGRGGRDFRVDVVENISVAEGDVVKLDRFNVALGRVVSIQEAEALGKKRVFIRSLVPLFESDILYVEQ